MAKYVSSAISPSPYKVTKKCVKKQFKIWRIKKKAITLHSQWRTNGSGRKGNPKQLSPESKTYANGEMAEWSIAAVLKTVEGHTSGGSNPSLSAKTKRATSTGCSFCCVRGGREPRGSLSRSACAARIPLSPPKQKSNLLRLLFLLTPNLTPVLGVILVVLFYLG